jgi:hypothetical protein
MFAKTIVLSDAFLDMPLSARCLYFTLGMFADDDGFVNSPKGIMRQCGASEDDIKILMSKKFLLAFESGVIVINHWRINNYLLNDRYQETKYLEENSKKKNFIPPSVEEVKEYLLSVGSKVDAEAFVAFYESKDWMIGKNKMKNWKSAIVTWEKRNGLKREKVSRKVTNADEEPEIDLWSD